MIPPTLVQGPRHTSYTVVGILSYANFLRGAGSPTGRPAYLTVHGNCFAGYVPSSQPGFVHRTSYGEHKPIRTLEFHQECWVATQPPCSVPWPKFRDSVQDVQSSNLGLKFIITSYGENSISPIQHLEFPDHWVATQPYSTLHQLRDFLRDGVIKPWFQSSSILLQSACASHATCMTAFTFLVAKQPWRSCWLLFGTLAPEQSEGTL